MRLALHLLTNTHLISAAKSRLHRFSLFLGACKPYAMDTAQNKQIEPLNHPSASLSILGREAFHLRADKHRNQEDL
ncbi:hypothetical protein FHEFKHOI_00624 [Candidatus Methanoperedenaceae archaeon GB50]|nr:hypothetical protein FHEFKHOI_00624 [Candidatus Methanoperedenaceae archaeon GB50]